MKERNANLRATVARHMPSSHVRITWIALGSIGFKTGDNLHVPSCLPQISDIANELGVACIGHPAMASVVIQERPRETELLTQLSRLRPGNRLLVFNDEADIENMPERCFELVTACIFDHESKRVLRVFDGYRPRRSRSYIDVELNDVSDAVLAANAARIAALR